MQRPVDVFFSYAHEDATLVDDVRRHLRVFERQGVIRKFHDRSIAPGTEWQGQIDDRLRISDIILLFVSPDFFDSDYCHDVEMAEAMARHRLGTARVIPIILRECLWQSAPFAGLKALPTDGHPVTLWSNRDSACANVASGVMRAVDELSRESAPTPSDAPRIEDRERILKVRVHRAVFVGRPTEHYFVNLTNLSPRRVLEVTHVWYEDETNHVPVFQPTRPLPVRLDLEQSWETWIECESLPPRHRKDAFNCFRARVSSGEVFTSTANPDVPPMGSVPGGPTS